MRGTPEPQIRYCFRPSKRMCLNMVELEEVAASTAPSLVVDKSALAAVTFEHSSSNGRGHALSAPRFQRRIALRSDCGLMTAGERAGIRSATLCTSEVQYRNEVQSRIRIRRVPWLCIRTATTDRSKIRILRFIGLGVDYWARFVLKFDRQFDQL